MDQHSTLSKILRTAAPIAILIVGVAGFLLMGKLKSRPAAAAPEESQTVVTTAAVEAHGEGLDIRLDGAVTPYREIDLSAEVPGRIKTKPAVCKSGNYVKQGDLLFEIDARDYELDVERLTKEREQAAVMLQELDEEVKGVQKLLTLADEDIELRRREVRRQAQLAGVSREADLDQAKQAELQARLTKLNSENQLRLLNTRRSRLEFARDLAAAQLEKAQLDLARTRVTAPVNGVIVSESVEENAYVQRGAALVTIVDTSKVEVKCNLRMEELYWIWRQVDWSESSGPAPGSYEMPPTEVSVVYRLGGHDYLWKGVLSRYDGSGLDEKTRTVPCRVVVDEPLVMETSREAAGSGRFTGPRALVSGMYVTVVVHATPRADLLRIPESALRPGNVVWLVRDNTLSIEPVHFIELVHSDAAASAGAGQAMAIIHAENSDLRAGDRVVNIPLPFVKSGMTVQVKDKAS